VPRFLLGEAVPALVGFAALRRCVSTATLAGVSLASNALELSSWVSFACVAAETVALAAFSAALRWARVTKTNMLAVRGW